MENEIRDEEKTKTEKKQAEGFALMEYTCQQCKKIETLWNSRDAVTPFMIGCRFCGGAMQHTNWHKDKYSPDYFPHKGQRVFIDMTKELHELLWKVNIEANWNKGEFKMCDNYESKAEALKKLTADFDPKRREPYVLQL